MTRLPVSLAVLMLLASALVLGGCSHSRIVKRSGDASPSTAQAHKPAPGSSRAEPSPIPASGTVTVRAGETLYGISFRFGLRFQDVAAWNGISDPYVINVGQRLRLRPAGQSSTQANTATAPRPPGSSATGVATAPATRVPPASATQAPPSIGPAPNWRWPTQGQIVGRYVAGDQTQQGINIAGTSGQSVVAAADGVVVYSGAGLVGYGELIIIKHSDEWLSAYAHNRRRLLGEGAKVRAGDAIAEMGRTGASRDMLHFEIRRNGKPVDPLLYLPRQ
jgi:lipoprotein NlpD